MVALEAGSHPSELPGHLHENIVLVAKCGLPGLDDWRIGRGGGIACTPAGAREEIKKSKSSFKRRRPQCIRGRQRQ
jgi:hypothetical protein